MKKPDGKLLRSERGFTLVELGVVMAIIAILAAITYPVYSGMKERAEKAEAKAVIQETRVEFWADWVEGKVDVTKSDGKTKYYKKAGEWTIDVSDYDKDATGEEAVVTILANHSGSINNIELTLNANGSVSQGSGW